MNPLFWMESSLADIRDFPEEVRQMMGGALYLAQLGEKRPERMTAMTDLDDGTGTRGSGNVFADLGVAEPEDTRIKAELAHTITSLVRARGLTQSEAAAVLGIDQPKVSALTRGRLAGFSVERLLRLLTALDLDVEIVVTARQDTHAHTRVRVEAGAGEAH